LGRTAKAPADSAEPGSAANPSPPVAIFARSAEYWTIGYPGATFSLKDIKGLAYLQLLLRYPGREFMALDLTNETGSTTEADIHQTTDLVANADLTISGLGDAGEMLDAQAKQQYRRRLLELKEESEALQELGNVERAEKVRSEIEAIQNELARAIGIGGRNRRAGSASERARLSVSRAIKGALQKIAYRWGSRLL
jgi:hypothetical protein